MSSIKSAKKTKQQNTKISRRDFMNSALTLSFPATFSAAGPMSLRVTSSISHVSVLVGEAEPI